MSMGGLALEDHRLFHDHFRSRRLLTFDSDPATVSRQKFNRPYSFIKCEEMSSSQFVNDYGTIAESFRSPGPSVVWLDYTSPSERNAQLREIQQLVTQMSSRDIVKVTLNANPRTLAPREISHTYEQFREEAASTLQQQLGDYATPELLHARQMDAPGVASILVDAVRLASVAGVEGARNLSIRPLTSFRYIDAVHQMLTVTLLVAEDEDWEALVDFGLLDWPFASRGWEAPRQIRMPSLTIKEQLRLAEEVLVNDPAQIVAKLPFRLGTRSESQRQIEEYVRHYLRYPTFVPINV